MTDYTFEQLINIQLLQRFLESHQPLSGLTHVVIDVDENVLIATGLQDICVRFFRDNPRTCAFCCESDVFIKAHLHDFTGVFLEYRCKNGMIHIAMPVVIDGRHVATCFVTQFFYDDDRPDMAHFRTRAEEFGFDTNEFLTALGRVPVFSREHIRNNVLFMQNVVQALADMGMKSLENVREMEIRKRAEESLRESEQRFRSYFDLGLVGSAILSPCRDFLSVNDKICNIFGYKRSELLQMKSEELIHPDDLAADYAECNRVLTGEIDGYSLECRFIRKDGQVIWTIYSVKFLRGEDSSIDCILGHLQDITVQKLAVKKITVYQEQLRSMASEISFVEERERHKISTALHDQVGQPLAMAGIKLEYLRKMDIPRNLDRQFAEILDMINHALRDSRTLTFELSPPILYDLGLEAAIFSLAERYQKEHGIRIDSNDDRRPKPLSEDMRVLLFQGVRELIVNAVKHAHPRRISISCEREGTEIRIMVEDDGVGFAPADGENMTEKNSGFGLFSLRERLKYLGGSIDITSSPGGGTQVVLTAPLAVETVPDK